jgi:hypothetical protein
MAKVSLCQSETAHISVWLTQSPKHNIMCFMHTRYAKYKTRSCISMEVGQGRRNAPNYSKEGDMKDRFTHLWKKRAEESNMLAKAKALFSSRSEVDINANGTSGYVIKHGPHKGKVLAHRIVKSNNNW